jgi:hypothetical protein
MVELKDPHSFALVEPRIACMARELQRILSFVDLESDGTPVQIDGFRLRDLSQWQNHVAASALSALRPISGVCNSRCEFCFEYGLPFAREASLMPLGEATTRLKYYSPDTARCLFPSNRPEMETFVHPQALDIIEMARVHDPGVVYWITTNGSYLDEGTVARLSLLKPLVIKLSLNVADPALHRRLMGLGERTEIALQAPRLLRDYRIPFVGGIVAWPTLPPGAIEETVDYLAGFLAYAIRVRLPLVHKWVRVQPDCDLQAHWDHVVDLGRRLREKCQVPLIVEPPIYSMNAIVPEVDGVIVNSPAHQAGVRAGDIVRSINGQAVRTRTESAALLMKSRLNCGPVDLTLGRAGEEVHYRLADPSGAVDTYPYDASAFYRGQSLGILHLQDFRLEYARNVLEVIESYGARNVLLFSSPIVAPLFQALVDGIPEYAERLQRVAIHLATINENTLGGNFNLTDSRFVEDYAQSIRNRLDQGLSVDLVLIPDAFGSPWHTDLTGASVSELEMEFGVPVEVINWHLVYGPDV